MKLMFNKINLCGQWFNENEEVAGFTEKVPPDTAHIWNEETNEWVLLEPEISG